LVGDLLLGEIGLPTNLARPTGYEPVGADPDRNFSGVIPWFGSLKEVERRMQELQKRRDVA
jgi:hypothetical protein